jgi:pimeloyl-ACP methyl ester carboxylesterase
MRFQCAWVLTLALAAGGSYAQPASADRFLTVNGLRLHYLEWGDSAKPALVLLHGIGRDAHSFDHIAPHFVADYRVIALDLRGHGDSAWHADGAYLVDDFVRDLEGVVEQLALRDVTVLGNSTGGRVALVYAGRHADRVRALVVEDVGPERPKDIAAGFARRVREEANGWTSEDDLLAHLKSQSAAVGDDLLRAHVRSATKRREDGRLVWKRDPKLVNGFVPTELWQDVRRITSPTLFVLGGRSTIVSPETQAQLARTIRGCEIVVMPGIGHYPHLEAPAEYVRLVRDFLRR